MPGCCSRRITSAAAPRPAAAGAECCGSADVDFQHVRKSGRRARADCSKVMSLTRTTLRPLTSMICWSSRSRRNAQHVLVGMVGRQHLVAEADALEGNGRDLVVANAQPSRAGADQKTVDSKRVDQRNECRIAEPADFRPLRSNTFRPRISVKYRISSAMSVSAPVHSMRVSHLPRQRGPHLLRTERWLEADYIELQNQYGVKHRNTATTKLRSSGGGVGAPAHSQRVLH